MINITQRYLSVDGLFQIMHHIPEASTSEEREFCLPENYHYYTIYSLNSNGQRIGICRVSKVKHESSMTW